MNIPGGMNFDPVKCLKEMFSRAEKRRRINFAPLFPIADWW